MGREATCTAEVGAVHAPGKALLGEFEPAFAAELRARGATPLDAVAGAELLLLRADGPEALERVPVLAAGLLRGMALWIVAPKGKGSPVPESAVLAAGRAAGLVDTKVARFSASHTAHRFVPRKE